MNRPVCLLATFDFPPLIWGGIQRYYYDLCCKSGGRVSVLAPSGPGCQEFDKSQPFETTRVRLPMAGGIGRVFLILLLTLHVARLLATHKYKKLVVGHWFLLPPLAGIARLLRVKAAIVLHGGELSRYDDGSFAKRLLIASFNQCHDVIVNSLYTAKQYIDYGVDEHRIRILTPAVDSDRYRPAHQRRPNPDGGQADFQGITLLTVATLVERKGHASVIHCLPELIARHKSVRYIVIGDGSYRPELTALVERLKLSRDVSFLGRIPDDEVLEWLRASDIFVMPSRLLRARFGEEGFGIVYLEANACEKPVIGGDSGGVRDAVIHGVTGLLVNPESNEELFQALDRLIGDPDLRASLGKQGRQRVVSDFQWRDRVETFAG